MLSPEFFSEKMRIYSLVPTSMLQCQQYETTLYDDNEASPELCTAKAIAYNTFIIGGLIAHQVKRHITGEPIPLEIIFDLSVYGWHTVLP